jgi:hypothetical protein
MRPEHLNTSLPLTTKVIALLNKTHWLTRLGGKCTTCGEADPRCLIFDYTDKAQKKVMSQLLQRTDQAPIEQEAEKVKIRCLNCQARRGSHIRKHRIESSEASEPRKAKKRTTQKFDDPSKKSILDI